MDSFRREKTLRERLAEAREVVKKMGDPQAEAPAKSRQQAAQERAARERMNRLEAAAKEMMVLKAEEKEQEEKDKVFFKLSGAHRDLLTFPTRRSSDLLRHGGE